MGSLRVHVELSLLSVHVVHSNSIVHGRVLLTIPAGQTAGGPSLVYVVPVTAVAASNSPCGTAK